MVDLLKSLYEQNELYHGEKERMAWQALALYLTFSLFFMKWMYDNANSIAPGWPLAIAFIAFIPAFFLTKKQIYLKAVSARKSPQFWRFLYEHPLPTKLQFSLFLRKLVDWEEHLSRAERCCIFLCEGWPQMWALISMAAFFIVQLMAIYFWCLDP
ncbi:MAG: hypothetical protein A2V99_05100 [Spirochaetes bacterium RBG_16_67_19]|nr:MAG: hypothetical protein A2V99_05100 [Spirochaetes bacterium RBG_16_67_19]